MATEVIKTEKNDEINNVVPKKLIVSKVKGVVKWFNVRSGYGFINRDDTKEDVFVHHSSIIKSSKSNQYVPSVGDDELVEFDIVQGEKGLEASNVTGPDGQDVKGSQYAKQFRRYRGRGRWRSGQRYRGSRRSTSGDEDNHEQPSPRGDGINSNFSNFNNRRTRGQSGQAFRNERNGRGFRGSARGGLDMYMTSYDQVYGSYQPYRGRYIGGRPVINGNESFGPPIMGDHFNNFQSRGSRSRGRGGRWRGRRGRGGINDENPRVKNIDGPNSDSGEDCNPSGDHGN